MRSVNHATLAPSGSTLYPASVTPDYRTRYPCMWRPAALKRSETTRVSSDRYQNIYGDTHASFDPLSPCVRIRRSGFHPDGFLCRARGLHRRAAHVSVQSRRADSVLRHGEVQEETALRDRLFECGTRRQLARRDATLADEGRVRASRPHQAVADYEREHGRRETG